MSLFNPKIYAVCLRAYRTWQRVYGIWISASEPISLMEEKIQEMLLHSPVPSIGDDELGRSMSYYRDMWAIHCTKNFGRHVVRSDDDLETISMKAAFIIEHGKEGMDVLDSQEGSFNMANVFVDALKRQRQTI